MNAMDPQFVSWLTANRQEFLDKWKSTFKWEKRNAKKSVLIGLPTVRATETAGSLKDFLNWLTGSKPSPNFSAISNLNMPKEVGQKVGTQ